MLSHCRSGVQQGMAMGHVNRHPFSVHPKSSMIHNNASNPFDVHRPYQQLLVDSSSTSAFQAVKDYSSCLLASSQLLQHQQQQLQNRHPHQVSSCSVTGGASIQNVEDVDVEAILHLGELQDWAWPSSNASSVVEAHEMKPSELQHSLQLPYHQAHQQQQHQSVMQLPSGNIHHQSSDIIHHSDQKSCNTSSTAAALLGTFPPLPLPPPQSHDHPSADTIPGNKSFDLQSWAAATTIKSFDLPSWCSGPGVRSTAQQSPNNIVIPKFLQAPSTSPAGGFTTSAEQSVVPDTNTLRVLGMQDVRERCTTAAVPLRSNYNNDHLINTAVATAYNPSNSNQVETSNSLLGVQKKWTGKRALSQRENHIWSERQRRKGMNHLFSTLRSLLPQPTSKTDKSTVVTEIIKYIKWLQSEREELQKKRTELLHRKSSMDVRMVVGTTTAAAAAVVNINSPCSNGNSNSSSLGALAVVNVPLGTCTEPSFGLLRSFVVPNVALHISGNNGFITMSSPKRRGLLSGVLSIMRSYKLLVLNAYMNTSGSTVFHCLHVMTPPGDSSDFPKENLQSSLQSLTLPDCSLL